MMEPSCCGTSMASPSLYSTLMASRDGQKSRRLTASLWSRTRSEERRVGKECRSRRDWSSDVCSSDLVLRHFDGVAFVVLDVDGFARWPEVEAVDRFVVVAHEIGRASCRERV